MRRAVFLVALLLAVVAVPPGAGAQTTPGVSPAETRFHVSLAADGDAHWRVTATYTLDTDNDTEAFRQYAARYVDGDPVPGPSATFFRRAAAEASNATGNEMHIRNVTRNRSVDGDTGSLVLSFVWTDFLQQRGDQLVLHDALVTGENGTWLNLRTLAPEQTLVVESPPGYDINSTSIPLTKRNRAFVVERPRMVDGPFTVQYSKTGNGGPTPTPDPEQPPWGLIAGGVAVVAVVLVGALAWRRRGDGDEGATAGAGRADADAEPTPRPTDGGAETAAAGEDEHEEDLELLSDEERVERLLDRNGGRMRQADIVTETDWSDAKVSQLLSKMADAGRVEKLRLGRENLISLPDYEDDEE